VTLFRQHAVNTTRHLQSVPRAFLRSNQLLRQRAAGTRADHWAAIEATPGLQGGFIWEFWDHGILQRVSDGRPAGRAGADLYDNGVATPGHHWAYGSDFGDAVHDGAFVADGVVFPDRMPEPAAHEHPEIAAPVGVERYRHEGIVLTNQQRSRSLAWLSGRWELVLDDGRTLTAPMDLPDLRPGETAAAPLPFLLPRDGGDAWLTLRVTTAEDMPWAPRGTELCAPQVRLRMAPEPAAEGPVRVDAEGLLVHPLLTAAPALWLWRAPAADEPGGAAPYLRSRGLDALVRKVVSVQRDEARVTVLAEYAGAVGVIRHRQVFTPLEGGIRVEEQAELPEQFDDVARVGSVFETVAGLDVREWFGHEPCASCPEQKTGAPVGHPSVPVDGSFTSGPRPQKGDVRHGVRRFTLSAPDATGLTVVLDEPRQVSVTLHRPSTVGTLIHAEAPAAHHDEPEPRSGCVVRIDGAHLGPGTACCAPDVPPSHLVAPGVHRWSWTLRTL
jgi:beta-galactosidase